MKLLRFGVFLFALIGAFGTPYAAAQWVERNFSLQDGWNAVFLPENPSPSAADDLFAGLPIRSVWARKPFSMLQGPPDCPSPDDPSCAPPPETGWEVWLPPSDPGRIATTLRLIRGGRVYLIEATAPTTLQVTGIPNGSTTKWQSGFNLVGFHVVDDPATASTFDGYLSPSDAFQNAAIYAIAPDGSPALIANPTTDRISPARGFWVKSSHEVEYDGPVRIDKGTLRGIDFGQNLNEHSVVLDNLTSSNLNVNFSYASSDPVPSQPPDPVTPAGDVPLERFDYNVGGQLADSLEWKPISANSWALDAFGQAASRRTVRLSVNRVGLAPAIVDADGAGSQYEGLLEVTDGNGFMRRVPVTSQVLPGAGGSAASGTAAAGPSPGLYYGRVTVNQVAWVSAGARVWTNNDPTDPTFEDNRRCDGGDAAGAVCEDDGKCPNGTCSPFCIGGDFDGQPCQIDAQCTGGRCSTDTDTATLRSTPAEFVFPIIIHLSDLGEAKLLTEVTVLWEPGDDVANTPGQYVLATPDCPPAVCDTLEAGSVQDGQPFARRISTAAYSFDNDLLLSGSFGTQLNGQTTLPADHPLNPFRHKYHPDHDCDLGGECFDITRSFAFVFDNQQPDTVTRAGWGDTLWTGTFNEQLLGLHKYPIDVAGHFEIQRVSQVARLNAQ